MLQCIKPVELLVLITHLLLITTTTCSTTGTVTVQISDGQIQGTEFVSSWTNKTIYAFLGIPYASPPVKDLRFKPPVPPTRWNGTKDCTSYGSSCLQNMPGSSEDCLYLNVYSPQLEPTVALAPVYVWIHGGAFILGTGSWCGPDLLVAEGVVVVTINYRLGAFGFLTLGTPDVPGNAAMFDQLLAMKWVQREVSKFGGDPNRITLGGESAGSIMVHLHYISPLSTGLFHAAIAESGTSLAIVAIDDAPSFGLQLAKLVNCSTADLSLTQQCLRNLSADVILANQALVQLPVYDSVGSFITPWVPIVDNDTNKDNPFLPATPAELISQGQGSAVPFLMGTNRDEGTYVLVFGGVDQRVKDITGNIRYLIPSEVLRASSDSSIQKKVQHIKDAYFGGDDPSVSTALGFVKMYGDYSFVYPTAKSAEGLFDRSSIFLYRFNFDGALRSSITDEFDKQLQTRFVSHGDEMGYLFTMPGFGNRSYLDPYSREMITSKRMVRLWTNFIKYRTPTPSPDSLLQDVTWTPVQSNCSYYLEISDNLTLVQSNYEAQVLQFWDDIFSMPSSATNLMASVFILVVLTLLL